MTVEQICPTEKQGLFRLVNADITGMCNLRCRFCFNDFAKADRTLMSPEQFEALTAILGQVPDERFFVSCLYEPTLHPRFADILALLPEAGRKKAFFTTNMARVLDNATLLAISRAKVAHVNISIETLRPNMYRQLCGSKRFRLFHENLELLARLRRNRQDIPPLRYITMVLQANYQELVPIVRVCKDKFGANEHELRTPYYDNYPQQKFVEEQLLSQAELEQLIPKLQATGQKISCDFNIWREQWEQMQQGGGKDVDCVTDGRLVPSRYFDVRVNASGLAEFNGGLQSVQLRPETTESIFAEQMLSLYKGLPAFFQTGTVLDSSGAAAGPGTATIEQCSCFADTLTFSGWYACPVECRPTHLQMANATVLVEHLPRPDVAAKQQLPSGWACGGFRTVLACTHKTVPMPTLICAEEGKTRYKWQLSVLPG